MRNPEEERKSTLLESLEACGLSDKQMEQAENYLSGETENGELGVESLQTYVAQSGNARDQLIEKCIERLTRHKDQELTVRYFSLLFQIFGVSLSPLYVGMYSVKKLIAADQRIALEATAYDGGRYFIKGAYRNLLEITSDREIFRKAVSYVRGRSGNALLYIYTAMFFGGLQGKPWNGKALGDMAQESQGLMGLLCTFLGVETAKQGADNGFETNEHVKRYPGEFQEYQELFLELICHMDGLAVSDSLQFLLRRFLLDKDIKHPMPREVAAFGAQVPLQTDRAQMMINMAVANYRLSSVIYQFLRIFVSTQMEASFEAMYASPCRNDMQTEILRWRADFAPDDERFILWLARKRGQQIQLQSVPVKLLEKMTKINPDAYVQALKSANADAIQVLSAAARESGNTGFVQGKLQPLISLQRSKYQEDVMEKITASVDKATQAVIHDFLTGKQGIETLYPHEAKISGNAGSYWNLSVPVQGYASIYGLDGFYDRVLAYLGMRGMEYTILPFCQNKEHSYQIDVKLIAPLLDRMARGGLDVARRLRVGALIQESYRGDAKEKLKELIKYFSRELVSHREETITAFQNAGVTGRLVGVNVLHRDPQSGKEALLAYVGESSKQVKEELVKIYAAHEAWMEDFLQILRTSKKAPEREMAATVLAKYPGVMKHQEALTALMETEKSKKVADLIREILRAGGVAGMEKKEDANGDGQSMAGQVLTPDAYVKECHKGGKKRGLAWLYEQPLPKVHFRAKEGEEACAEGNQGQEESGVASEEYMQAVLLSYSCMPMPGPSKDVLLLTNALNKLELSAFMDAVYERFMAQGAEAKKKWVLYAVAIHGGAKIVPKYQHQINEWAEASRGAMAAEAVKALTLNDSPTALLIVDGIARKYKFKQVRKAAQDAMAYAAAQLGLTVEELADRIVPDLGFDEQLERYFDYGARSFTVKISPNLEMEIKDENGKKIKSLPAIGKNDDEGKAKAALEEFKELKKQMKATVKNQALRLDLAMSLDRKWTVENWKKLFVKNPIMHQFAISLIWGHYKDDQLMQTFRYMEDGTFNTVDEEEYELAEEGKVGLVHPIELDAETISAWKEQLADYEITQSVEQLDRRIFTVSEEEKGKIRLERFGGKIMNGLSLAGKMTGLGWSKGMPEDAGVYYSFYRRDMDAGYGVELLFSGAYIADENDEITVYDAGIYALNDFDKSGYRITYGKDKVDKALALDKVSPRYFSEIVYQLTKATASSTETDEKWRETK